MNRDDDQMKWHPIKDAVDDFLEQARALSLPAGATFQDVIGALGDHNQAMLDSIEAASPGLYGAIDELLHDERDESRNVAFDLVNICFGAADYVWQLHQGH